MADKKSEEKNEDVALSKDETILALKATVEEYEKSNMALEKKVNKAIGRGLELKKANEMLSSSSEITKMNAQMQYDLAECDILIKGNALPSNNKFQAYVIVKAGRELGMKALESLGALYMVNGMIHLHSKALVSFIKKNGYSIEYKDEVYAQQVTVRVFNDDGFDESEQIKYSEWKKIFENSKAYKISPKNKLRFHGLRQILNFHLAHLVSASGVSAWEAEDIIDIKHTVVEADLIEESNRNKDWIENADSFEKLMICKEACVESKKPEDLDMFIKKALELSKTKEELAKIADIANTNEDWTILCQEKLEEINE